MVLSEYGPYCFLYLVLLPMLCNQDLHILGPLQGYT